MASVKSQGCTIGLSDGASPEVYTTIANATSIGGPTGSRAVIDATVLGSTAKEKDVGLADFGQVNCDFNFSSADAALIDTWDAFIAGTLHNFVITFTDSPQTTFSFAAYALNMSYNIGLDGIIQGSFTLEISGDVTDNLA